MKKIISILLIFAFSTVILVGCSSSNHDDSYDTHSDYSSSTDSSTTNYSYDDDDDYSYDDDDDYSYDDRSYDNYSSDNDVDMEEFIREQLGDGPADAYSEGERRWNAMTGQY